MADLIGAVNAHATVPVGTIWAKGFGLIRKVDNLHASSNTANEKGIS